MGIRRWSPLAVAVLALFGCHQPSRVALDAASPAVSTYAAEFPVLWEAAKDVLRRYRYKLDRVDIRAGRITTHPLGSQHFFEFWRNDVATKRDRQEASLCSIRRRVNVMVEKSPPHGPHHVRVTVRKERFSSPDRQFNSSTALYHFFSHSLPAARTGTPILPEDSTWVDLGVDSAMEQRILQAILEEASRTDPEALAKGSEAAVND